MKKTTLVIVAIIIAIIIFMCVFASGENKENANNENINNTVTNNEIINEMENEVIQNEIENEIANEEESIPVEDEEQDVEENKQNTENTETFEEAPATAEQKVINIVKEDFKQTNNIEVTVEGMNENGKYIVVVRDSKTTEALAFYTVDAANKTFTKKEMN